MRRTISSVWMAAVRQIVWKLLLIILVMAAVELGLLWNNLRQPGSSFDYSHYAGAGYGAWLDAAKWYWIFSAAFLLLTVALALQGADMQGGKLMYTLRRLPISEAAITTQWALVHIASFVIFWMAQLAVVLIGWKIYDSSLYGLAEAPALEMFVEFYLDGFLHGLLPLGCISGWVRQILWVLCMGTGTAWFGLQQRRGTIAFGPAVAAIVGVVTFRANVRFGEEQDVLASIVFGLMLIYNVGRTWRRAYEED